MASPTPTPPPASEPGPPPPPAAGASHDEWNTWRRQQRDYVRGQWRRGGSWYGPWWPYGGWWWGAVLVAAGVYFLLSNLGLLTRLRPDVFWPIVLILLGIWLIFRRGRWWRW